MMERGSCGIFAMVKQGTFPPFSKCQETPSTGYYFIRNSSNVLEIQDLLLIITECCCVCKLLQFYEVFKIVFNIFIIICYYSVYYTVLTRTGLCFN